MHRPYRDVVRAGATKCATAADRTRTDDLRFTKPLRDSTSGDDIDTYDRPDSTPRSNPSSWAENDPDLDALIRAWPTLPDAIRAGIVAMIRALGTGA